MKWDMGGAGAVAGAMKALATRKAKANVVGVCALAENMPDGNAQRPGDVVTSMSGQTIEVINTDAEGRLVLADAMTWAQREYKPEVMVDLATLTGAMVISLGHEYGGMFSNDDGLAERPRSPAGKASGDKLWRHADGRSLRQDHGQPIADMKNSAGREGGSITAACFLEPFVEEGVKWAHLDIAGMVWSDKAEPSLRQGRDRLRRRPARPLRRRQSRGIERQFERWTRGASRANSPRNQGRVPCRLSLVLRCR